MCGDVKPRCDCDVSRRGVAEVLAITSGTHERIERYIVARLMHSPARSGEWRRVAIDQRVAVDEIPQELSRAARERAGQWRLR